MNPGWTRQKMLKNQVAKGNNGLMWTKYITYGIDAENYETPKEIEFRLVWARKT